MSRLFFSNNFKKGIGKTIYCRGVKTFWTYSRVLTKSKKSNSFKNIELNNSDDLKKLIHSLKTIYEDFWKENNLINSSIKLSLSIKIDNKNFDLTTEFEKTLDKIDLISSYSINKFNQNFIFYEIIFNGTPKNFINIMNNQSYNFDMQLIIL